MAQATAQQAFGKYQVISKLAEGSMGAVYKALDPSTSTEVAIKVAAMAVVRDKVMLQRFEQEFRTTSTLNHPNIVRGLEFGWNGPKPYIVLEYVDGENLWSRIDRQGPLPEAEAVDLIRQVAEGLHEAHKHGIIHRDIKPDNILLTNDGGVKLADLGLSKDLEDGADLTRPGHRLGSPNFIAPEQFGDAKNVTVHCDIYSLGTTLYMALTGQVPFAATSLSSIMALKFSDDLTPPRKLAPTLSERVDWAVRRAIQADPSRRYASCPEFVAALTGEDSGLIASADGNRRIATRLAGKKGQRGGKERRTSLRYDCALPTSCIINLSLHEGAVESSGSESSWDAQICSLSIGGVGLFLQRRFEPGSLLEVVFTSRSGHVKESRQMRVVRVAPAAGAAGWFLAGTLIKSLSKEELRQLL